MRIAIIGAGKVGGALGAALYAIGHTIVFGVRDPDSPKCRQALAASPGATATTPAAAPDGADVVIVTIRSEAVAETIPQLPSLAGRIVIDAMDLAAAIGFEPWDAGGIANAKPLEEMTRVWLGLTATHGRTVGFAISTG